ncbi:MAG: hypothetical protein P8I57_01395 [Amylibacter sp.]|nr:hypothetical protein [Amylibacter sp.]
MNQRTIIITGSGRSGTYNIHEFLKNYSNYSVHHELNFNKMLKAGVLSYESVITESYSSELVDGYLRDLHQKKPVGVDVSNAAIWCINELHTYCEDAEFHMVIRNGYKVVSSFYYKFQELMYPESKIRFAQAAFKNKKFEYPLDKTFWRPLPQDLEFYEKYERHLRFAIICWYWTETIKYFEENIDIFTGLYRFEDIVSGLELEQFCEDLGIEYSAEKMLKFFKRPTNIDSRVNYKLSKEQKRIFMEICGDHMNKYYPNMDYYDVKY